MQFHHVATRCLAHTVDFPSGGSKIEFCSIKNKLNFEVTFTCHFEPLYGPTWLQLSPNLASKIPPKAVSRQCWNATSWKADFCNLFQAKYKFLLLPGAPKTSKKIIPRQLFIRVPFQLKQNSLQASILLQLGSLLGLPRRPQEASKAS